MMNDNRGREGAPLTVRYELTISAEEAQSGVTKILTRKNKRLEVVVPPGSVAGKQIKLTNALQSTDGQPGDILILIKIKIAEESDEESMGGVLEINDPDFEREVLQAKLPVMVDFWASWCGPCRAMAPAIDQVAEQYRGKFKFCKINVDENPQAASRYRATSIPLLLFFRNGQVIDQSLGAIPISQLKSKIDSLL
jgi:thioredoxin 1